MDINLDHIVQRRRVGLEDSRDIVYGALRLLLNAVTDEFAAYRINRAGAGNEHKIAGSPSLRICALRRCATFGLDHILGHAVSTPFSDIERTSLRSITPARRSSWKRLKPGAGWP